MPRTKQPRKRSSSNSISKETELLIADFEMKCEMELKKLEKNCDMIINRSKLRIDTALSRLPKQIREMTLGDLFNMSFSDENHDTSNEMVVDDDKPTVKVVPPSTSKPKRMIKRQTAASMEDGYVSEGATQRKTQTHVSRIDCKDVKTTLKARRVNRSSSQNSNSQTSQNRASSNTRTSRQHSKMTTPAAKAKTPLKYNLITPKTKPNTPLHVLRRPRDGEMALSMQGSPLYVAALAQDRMANVNVPLNNGNFISLLPRDGLRLSYLPQLDDETMKQLKTLKNHIEKVIGSR